MTDEIINKVSQSGLITIDLKEFRPEGVRDAIDIKDWLFEELILREKDFRQHVKDHDWSRYANKLLAIHCTADAIVPTWAYMLVAVAAKPFAQKVYFGSPKEMEDMMWNERLEKLDLKNYSGQRIVIKGCSDAEVPVSAYVKLTELLQPQVKSIMYGEPCSTVPVFKRKD